jgi:hypothetical protein
MVELQLNDEEAEILRRVLENYTSHLDVEIHRAEHHWEFRKALEKQERLLHDLIGRLGSSR